MSNLKTDKQEASNLFEAVNKASIKGNPKPKPNAKKENKKEGWVSYRLEYLHAAHKASFENKVQLLDSEICGCFSCLMVYSPLEITDWVEDKNGETAICPKCGIDSVIGSKSEYPITDQDFLKAMQSHYFFRPPGVSAGTPGVIQ